MPYASAGKEINPFINAANFPTTLKLPNPQSMPHANRGEQSGDRQRRERPAILTAEKESSSAHDC